MPRSFSNRIINTEAAVPQRPAVGTEVVASPVNTMVQPVEDELSQLGRALGSIHEPLARIYDRKDKEAQHDALLLAKSRSATTPDPATAEGAELAMGDVAPAYRKGAMEAYSEGIGHRLGIGAGNDYLGAVAQEMEKPDFNFEAYSAKFRADHLAGLSDPNLAIGAAQHIDHAINEARGHYRVVQQKKLTEERNASLGEAFSLISPTREPEANAEEARKAIDTFYRSGGTRATGANLLFQHLVGLSTRFNGRPELFDVFDTVDPTTKLTLAQMNPALADQIGNARVQAEHQLQANLHKQGLKERSIAAADLETGLYAGQYDSMTPEQVRSSLLPHVGENGLFNSDKEMAAFEHRVYERQAKVALVEGERKLVQKGLAARLPESAQRDRLEEAVQDHANVVLDGINDPAKANAVAGALNAIVVRSRQGGFSVAYAPVKNIMASLKNEAPAAKGATRPPKFDAAVRFYQDLKASGNPRLVTEYFEDEGLRDIMETYIRNTGQNQVGSDSAYHLAYEVNSPEAKARTAALLKDPNVEKEVRSIANSTVDRIRRTRNWFLDRIPFTNAKKLGYEPDTSGVEFSLQSALRNRLSTDVNMGADEALKFAEEWRTANTYYDPATNAVLEIPQQQHSPVAEEALTEWLGDMSKAWSAGDQKVVPRIHHKGNGVYALTLVSPRGIMPYSDVDLKDIVSVYQARKNLTGDDLKNLGVLRGRVLSGTATPEEVAEHQPLIQKASDLGVVTGDFQKRTFALRQQALAKPTAVFGKAVELAETRRAVSPSAALRDPDQFSVPVAQQFLQRGDLAGALTSMGERVRLVAYKDPARGMNIGLGYNMDANAKNLAEDFRKAGIPVEQIDAIKAGKRSITVEQAIGLYGAVKPRYEKIAKAGMEKQFPGEWQKLPANAQAVLTDLAYQTGNVGQFEQGLLALKSGDFSGSGLQSSFIDRETKRRRVDERRHALRVAMLKNVTSFKTLFSHAAKQPGSAIEVRAAIAGDTPS